MFLTQGALHTGHHVVARPMQASLVATAGAKAPRQPAEERVLTATVPYRRQANRVSGTQSPQRRPTKTNTTKNATAKKFDRPKLDVKPSDPGLSQPNAENLRTMVWVSWATPPSVFKAAALALAWATQLATQSHTASGGFAKNRSTGASRRGQAGTFLGPVHYPSIRTTND